VAGVVSLRVVGLRLNDNSGEFAAGQLAPNELPRTDYRIALKKAPF